MRWRELQAKEKELEDMEARLSAVVQENVRSRVDRAASHALSPFHAVASVCRLLLGRPDVDICSSQYRGSDGGLLSGVSLSGVGLEVERTSRLKSVVLL